MLDVAVVSSMIDGESPPGAWRRFWRVSMIVLVFSKTDVSRVEGSNRRIMR